MSELEERVQKALAFLLAEGAIENPTQQDYLFGRAQSNEQALYNILVGRDDDFAEKTEQGWPTPAPLPPDYWETAE